MNVEKKLKQILDILFSKGYIECYDITFLIKDYSGRTYRQIYLEKDYYVDGIKIYYDDNIFFKFNGKKCKNIFDLINKIYKRYGIDKIKEKQKINRKLTLQLKENNKLTNKRNKI